MALVLKSEFEQELRLDSELFQRKFINLAKLVAENQITKLGDESLSIKKGIFDIKADSYSEHGVPFVRISNLKNMLIDTKDIIYIPEHESRNNPDSFLIKNDIILSKTAYPAASLVNLDFCNASQDTIAVKLKPDSKLMSHFVVVYLNTVFGLEAMKRRFTGNIQMHLNLENCKNLSIPVLSYSFQQKVKDVFEQGIISTINSKSAYASAEALLLQSLGLSDFDLDAGDGVNSNIKPFAASFLESGRLDAEYYQRKYEIIEEKLKVFKRIKVGELVNYPVSSGSTPKAGGDDYTDEINGAPFIRAVDLVNGEVSTDNLNYIKKQIHNSILKRTKLQNGDVLLSIAGTVGRCALFNYNFEANINQAIAILRFEESELSKLYVVAFFNSKIGAKYIEKYARQGVQTNLNLNEVSNLEIPIVDRAIQEHISDQIRKSFSLRDNAKKLLTLAKQAVETAIEQGEAAGEALLETALSEETT